MICYGFQKPVTMVTQDCYGRRRRSEHGPDW